MENVKLIRLSGEQASRYWPVLSQGFSRALPPGTVATRGVLNNMLIGILRRNYDCWVVKVRRDGKWRQVAGAITSIRVEPMSGLRSMLIYSLFSQSPLEDEEWEQAFSLLAKVARKGNCAKVTAYSRNPSVLEMVERLGGDTQMRYIELGV